MNDNSVHLIGRLGQDPEISYIASGDAVCNFSIAVSEYYKKSDSDKDFETETTWIPITAWRRLAERVAATAKKGTEVLVIGKLREKKWEDKDTKKPRSRMYVLAGRMDFGDGRIIQEKTDTSESAKSENPPPDTDKKKTEEEDDLPF